jgi:hypothetical protein
MKVYALWQKLLQKLLLLQTPPPSPTCIVLRNENI